MGDSTVTIGEAAALYGLAPSTLRWWEEQGVLERPERSGDRRRYGEDDLRRIGLAYLCCINGMMPLDRAAVVTSEKSGYAAWQDTVSAEISSLERQIRQMEGARDYLRHLLLCEHDDIAQCPLLDPELTALTPRGHIPEPDLVTAAHEARKKDRRATSIEINRDESPVEETKNCLGCGCRVEQSARGRPRIYCSRACQQRAYRKRLARRRSG